MLVALTSAKGSPGVSTAALAMTLAWNRRRRAVLAECDPAGGEVLAGYGRATESADSLTDLLFAARRGGGLGAQLWSHLVRLDPAGRALLLPGLTDPGAARAVAWDRLGEALAGLDGEQVDVLADCGRLGAEAFPAGVLLRASAVLVVTRSSLRAVAAARTAVGGLRRLLADAGTGGQGLGLLLVDPGRPYGAKEIAREVGAPVVATLPVDRRAAGVLSDGAPAGRGWAQSTLMRAARAAAADVAGFAAASRDRLADPAAAAPSAPARERVVGRG